MVVRASAHHAGQCGRSQSLHYSCYPRAVRTAEGCIETGSRTCRQAGTHAGWCTPMQRHASAVEFAFKHQTMCVLWHHQQSKKPVNYVTLRSALCARVLGTNGAIAKVLQGSSALSQGKRIYPAAGAAHLHGFPHTASLCLDDVLCSLACRLLPWAVARRGLLTGTSARAWAPHSMAQPRRPLQTAQMRF